VPKFVKFASGWGSAPDPLGELTTLPSLPSLLEREIQ